jgi:hypothetical protein
VHHVGSGSESVHSVAECKHHSTPRFQFFAADEETFGAISCLK